MRIADIDVAAGLAGFLHFDRAAIRAGRRRDGYVYEGKPITPGFAEIVQPAAALSVLLILEDGQVAFGDCMDVCYPGLAGRYPVFIAADHMPVLRDTIAPRLKGRDVADFKALADEVDGSHVGGRRLHAALRYGLTQALAHAAALAGRRTVAEILADAYGLAIIAEPVPILAGCDPENAGQIDRMIVKRAAMLPHTYITSASEFGSRGERFIDYVRTVAHRVEALGGAAYRPTLHFDLCGVPGEVFDQELATIARYLMALQDAAAPYPLLIEAPLVAASQDAHIDAFSRLRDDLRQRGAGVGLVADEWCNTLDDIKLFAERGAGDYVQIKMPDLGGIQNSLLAVRHCRAGGMGAFLGGSANETDQSTRISVQVALAARPDFMLAKPGRGGDEGLMIETNEMARALTLIRRTGATG